MSVHKNTSKDIFNGDNLNKRDLTQIQSLSMLKMEKNFVAVITKGYCRQPYKELPFSYLMQRLREEMQEFEKEFEVSPVTLDTVKKMKNELADISNITDYLFETLLSFEMASIRGDKLG